MINVLIQTNLIKKFSIIETFYIGNLHKLGELNHLTFSLRDI